METSTNGQTGKTVFTMEYLAVANTLLFSMENVTIMYFSIVSDIALGES